MYKKTELPTMELAPGLSDHRLIESSFEFCRSTNIERLIININEKNINEVPFFWDEAESSGDLCVFFRCNTSLYEDLRAQCRDIPVILIVNKIEDVFIEQLDYSLLFFEVKFDGTFNDEINIIKSSIIWNIPFREIDWQKFNDSINFLLEHYNDTELMVKQNILTKTLIKEHPCNVYLCSSSHCHSKHGDFPRVLYVSSNGRLFPYGIEDDRLCVGNILSKCEILHNEYNNSTEKTNFIKINRKVYLDTIDKCCYELIPWFELIKERLDEC